jgi:hypothetical protein
MLMMPMTQQEALKWIAVLLKNRQPASAGDNAEEIAAWDSLGMLTLMAGMNDSSTS